MAGGARQRGPATAPDADRLENVRPGPDSRGGTGRSSGARGTCGSCRTSGPESFSVWWPGSGQGAAMCARPRWGRGRGTDDWWIFATGGAFTFPSRVDAALGPARWSNGEPERLRADLHRSLADAAAPAVILDAVGLRLDLWRTISSARCQHGEGARGVRRSGGQPGRRCEMVMDFGASSRLFRRLRGARVSEPLVRAVARGGHRRPGRKGRRGLAVLAGAGGRRRPAPGRQGRRLGRRPDSLGDGGLIGFSAGAGCMALMADAHVADEPTGSDAYAFRDGPACSVWRGLDRPRRGRADHGGARHLPRAGRGASSAGLQAAAVVEASRPLAVEC